MTVEQSMSDILGGLLDSYRVRPDPPRELVEAAQEADRKLGMFALMQDRGCPRKLAREVAKLREGHGCIATHALEAVIGWLMIEPMQVGRECCVLAGQRGRGKSYAAAQALARIKPGQGCPRWSNARHVSKWLHTQGYDEGAKRSLDRIAAAPMLILDDMGWEHFDKGGYSQGAFIGIIDDRIQQEKRTIMTTNLDETSFRQRYGDALHDRIRGYGLWVDVEEGGSMR